MRRLPLAVAVSLTLGLAGLLAVLAQEKKGINYAFLVACSKYQFGLPELPYTVKEIKEFRDVLLRTGFDRLNVKLLADGEDARYLPEKDKILRKLERWLARVGPNDTAVVVLNGHGVRFKGDKVSSFCAANSKVSDPPTLLPLDGKDGLFEKLRTCKAGRKLLLVNACRNDPELDRSLAANRVELDKETEEEVPEGIAALFSCKPNQKSYYYDPKNPKTRNRERSLFFHHLIESWQGNYAAQGQPVTLEDVFRKVQSKTAADADDLYGETQVPDPRREYQGEWVINARAGSSRSKVEQPKTLEIDLSKGVFYLRNRYTGKYLDLAAIQGNPNGAAVRGWALNRQTNQQWRFESLGDGKYRVNNVWSGKCLDNAVVEGNPNGAKIYIWRLNNQLNQVWLFQPAGEDLCRLRNVSTGKYLDMPIVQDNPDGVNVHAWEFNGQTNQIWQLIPETPR